MLISSFQRTALMLAVTVVAATGCGGSGTGAPTAVSPPITANGAASTASTLNVSGGFAGNVQDSVFGRGRIYAELAQYQNAVARHIRCRPYCRRKPFRRGRSVRKRSFRVCGSAILRTSDPERPMRRVLDALRRNETSRRSVPGRSPRRRRR
jgi:hypothetical protein